MPALGNEHPLDAGAGQAPTGSRHGLSLRWLGASVLIGIAGAMLLGSAIYVSSDGEVSFAESPERASLPSGRAGEAPGDQSRKGDKLVRAEIVASAKQTFRSPMTLRAGDREVIKVRSFVRISTGLSLTAGAYAVDIPPFNPLRFFADTAPDRPIEVPPETSDAEVSVVKSDLSTLSIPSGAAVLSDEQAATQLREEGRLRAEGGRRPAAPLPSTAVLSRVLGAAAVRGPSPAAAPAGEGPFRSIEVRVETENVTTVAKPVGRVSDLAFDERAVVIRRGDTLEGTLRGNGGSPDDSRAVASVLNGRERAAASVEGMQMRLLLAPPARAGEPRRLVRAILFGERGIEAIAAMNDRGAFVSVTPPQAAGGKSERRPSSEDEEEEDDAGGVTLYQSLYETALKQELPRQTIDDLVRIFGYDVDFQRRVTSGDTFEIFYATDDETGGERLEVLSAALTVGSEVHRVFRFQGDDGSVDYFDEAGRSLKKFLIRKPVVEARMSSGFGTRYHPILGYAKMHTGVDWAAPVGTPIMAAGNGTIIKAEMSSGYGRRTELQHANGYVTAYNHQSAFARGIVPGAKVRQGQIIGFVGSSGLSTGAHLHFEVIVNGHFVDPMRIRVPRGRELDGRALVDFSRQRDQIDGLIQKAGAGKLAQGEAR